MPSKSIERKIVDLRQQGFTYAGIEKKLNVSTATIAPVLKKYKLNGERMTANKRGRINLVHKVAALRARIDELEARIEKMEARRRWRLW